MRTPVSYLKRHWLGKHSVLQSFVLNLLLPITVLLTFQALVVTPWIQSGTVRAVPAASFLAISYAILFCWQIVGLNRAVRAEIKSAALPLDTWVINATIIVLVVFVVIRLIDTLSSGIAHDMAMEKSRGRANDDTDIGLNITFNDTYSRATIEGTLKVGATRLITEMLQQQPNLDTLILDSDGGSVFEGRGIGKIVKKSHLSTHVNRQCLSACTLAFAGGVSRTASINAVFGFHAYRVDALYDAAWLNMEEQQKKDLAWFEQQGVAEWYRNRIYDTDSNAMWLPDRAEMIRSGFLTADE